MSNSKNTDYACFLCKKVKFFKTFDNLLKHNCRFHNCEKEIINKKIKETMDEKILRLIPNVGKMFFVCVNALKKINKQIINKEYKLKTYIKIELNEPVFIHLDEPIFIEKIVTETIEEFEEVIIVKEDAIFIEQNVTETIEEFEEEILLIENITDEMIKEDYLNEYENIVSDDEVIFIDGQCYKVFDSIQDYENLKKKAYYKLSRKYHPDKNSQKNSLYYTEYFKKIRNYYDSPQINQIFTEDKNYIPEWFENLDFDEYMGFAEDRHNFFNTEKEKYYNEEDYFMKYVKGEDYLNNLLKYYITSETIDEEITRRLKDEEEDNKKLLKKIKDGRMISLMACYYIKYGYNALLYKFFKKNFMIKKAHEQMDKIFFRTVRDYFSEQPRFRNSSKKYIEKEYSDELDKLIKIIEDKNEIFYIPDEDFNFDLNFYCNDIFNYKYINKVNTIIVNICSNTKTMSKDDYDYDYYCRIEKYK